MDPTFDRAQLHDPGLLREDLFLDGAWVPGTGVNRTDVTDPATGAVIANEEAFGPVAPVPAVDTEASSPG